MPPSPPSDVRKAVATNIGLSGSEITWQPGQDGSLGLLLRSARDSVLVDKVAKGTYYFDHSRRGSFRYLRGSTVDGRGVTLRVSGCRGIRNKRFQVIDDANSSGINFQGSWQYAGEFAACIPRNYQPKQREGCLLPSRIRRNRVHLVYQLGDDGAKPESQLMVTQRRGGHVFADDIWGIGISARPSHPAESTK